MAKREILSLTSRRLKKELTDLGMPRFRAGQVFDWLHKKRAKAFSLMTNLSKNDREKLAEYYRIDYPKVLIRQCSEKDGTEKFLLQFSDKETAEMVAMKYKHGISLCISTQIGCKMGCSFCASTLAGFVRDMTAGEIISQVYLAEELLGEPISSIVLMGIGEPLDNFSHVTDFFQILSDPKGRNMSLRHVSLSTCGLADKIYDLMEQNLQLTLSISLHASDDKVRSELMPVNRVYPLDDLMEACDRYTRETGRRISYEYALFEGVNDSPEDAKKLAMLLKGRLAHVNLIPANRVKETTYTGSGNINEFLGVLKRYRINATIRRTLGDDIDAACGQLRRNARR